MIMRILKMLYRMALKNPSGELPQEPEMGDELKKVIEMVRDSSGECDVVIDFSSVC